MKTYPPNFKGWSASTDKDPHELVIRILQFSREADMGKLGVSGPTQNIIVFSGIQIQFIEKDSHETYLGRKLFLHFIDGKRIKRKFFDMWEYMKANNYVHGGPDEEDKKFFNDEGDRFRDLEIRDYWVDRYYSKPNTPRVSAEEWLQAEDAPSDITYKIIQRRRQERERLGEKFNKK